MDEQLLVEVAHQAAQHDSYSGKRTQQARCSISDVSIPTPYIISAGMSQIAQLLMIINLSIRQSMNGYASDADALLSLSLVPTAASKALQDGMGATSIVSRTGRHKTADLSHMRSVRTRDATGPGRVAVEDVYDEV